MSQTRSRPFTLLVLLGAGWLGLRMLIPDLARLPGEGEASAIGASLQPPAVQGRVAVADSPAGPSLPMSGGARRTAVLPPEGRASLRPPPVMAIRHAIVSAPPAPLSTTGAPPLAAAPVPMQAPHARPGPLYPALASATRRDSFTLSAWLLARSGGGTPAISGQAALGGSQAGLRGSWRLDRAGSAEAFVRLASSGRPGDGAEGAVGIALRPHRRLPLHLVAERRQALAGTGGRSAFAAYAVGGVDSRPAGPALIDAYGAAGVVGLGARDLFAEGSAVARIPLARLGPADLSAGGGVWAAAQPGASRIDVGPRAQLRWGDGPVRPVLSLDWRQRIAGDARPGSGPALTVGVDF